MDLRLTTWKTVVEVGHDGGGLLRFEQPAVLPEAVNTACGRKRRQRRLIFIKSARTAKSLLSVLFYIRPVVVWHSSGPVADIWKYSLMDWEIMSLEVGGFCLRNHTIAAEREALSTVMPCQSSFGSYNLIRLENILNMNSLCISFWAELNIPTGQFWPMSLMFDTPWSNLENGCDTQTGSR